MRPISYQGELAVAKEALKNLIARLPRTRLRAERDDYLHFTFRTPFGGFIDDVEFEFDDAARVIHFRSASRVGNFDFGVNRWRMWRIGRKWKSMNRKRR